MKTVLNAAMAIACVVLIALADALLDMHKFPQG